MPQSCWTFNYIFPHYWAVLFILLISKAYLLMELCIQIDLPIEWDSILYFPLKTSMNAKVKYNYCRSMIYVVFFCLAECFFLCLKLNINIVLIVSQPLILLKTLTSKDVTVD